MINGGTRWSFGFRRRIKVYESTCTVQKKSTYSDAHAEGDINFEEKSNAQGSRVFLGEVEDACLICLSDKKVRQPRGDEAVFLIATDHRTIQRRPTFINYKLL